MFVLIFVSWVVTHHYHFQSSRSQLSEALFSKIKLLEKTTVDQSLCSYADLLNVRITVMTEYGKVICDSWQNPVLMDNHSNRPEFQMALHHEESQLIRFSKTMQTDLLYVARRFSKGVDSQRIVRVSVPLKSYSSEFIHFLRSTLVGLLLVLICALIISYLCLGQILKPVLELKNWVSNIFYKKRLTGVIDSGILEIDELMVSFKDLIEDDRRHYDSLISNKYMNQTVLGTLNEGVIYITKDFIIHDINSRAGEILGLECQKFLGSNFMNLQLPYRLQITIEKCLSEGGIVGPIDFYSGEVVHLKKIDSTLCAEVRSVLTNKGKIQGAAVILEDRTKVDRLEQIRRDFVSNVSHQLNTPLTAIIGATYALGNEINQETPLQFLKMIDFNANRIKVIVDNLQHLAKLEETGASENIEKVKINGKTFLLSLQKEVLERDPENAKRLNLLVNQPFTLNINFELMHLAVMNIIENAFKYAPAGLIEVSASLGEWIHIDISDEGEGVCSDEMDRIFERFFRSKHVLNKNIPGTGLGLPLAKHILRVHGGRLSVFNRKPKGCTFRCSLPFSD